MIYFAYGSNMSRARLIKRVPSALQRTTGYLYGHELAFHKISVDGSGKCDAFKTKNNDDYIFGVLYQIDTAHRSILDKIEGPGYAAKDVTIKTLSNHEITAFTYYANKIDSDLKPYHWYKHHVLLGAKENNLPEKYIEKIDSVNSVDDHDNERAEKELSIYTDHDFSQKYHGANINANDRI